MQIFSYLFLFYFLLYSTLSSEEIQVEQEEYYSSHAETYIYRAEEKVLGSFRFAWNEDLTLRLDHFFVHSHQTELAPKLWEAACKIAQNLGARSFIFQVTPEEKAFYSLMGCRIFNSELPLLMKYKLSTPNRQLCIIGCGGGGTKYTSECLQTLGLDIGHETINTDGFIGWMFSVGAYSWKKIDSSGVRFKHIFHQVRNPLDAITTWSKYRSTDGIVWNFIKMHIPEISPEDTLIVQCAKYWYYWNLKAEKIAEYRYQVEKLPEALETFSLRLGVDFSPEMISSIPNNTHSWKGRPFAEITWPYLEQHLPTNLYQDIKDMALRYGYSNE